MTTIQKLLEQIHEIKRQHEESWNPETFKHNREWRDIIPEVVTDPVAADMAAVLISQAWNDCEDWLNFYIKN